MNTEKIIMKGFDCTFESHWYGSNHTVIVAESIGKAKSKFLRLCEYDNEYFKCIRIRRNKIYDLLENISDERCKNLNREQIHKMNHAIGNDFFKEEPYRNRYVIENDEDWEDLVRNGYAEKYRALNMNYYCVTKIGLQLLYSMQPIPRWRKEKVSYF